jgi:hypothetical protein
MINGPVPSESSNPTSIVPASNTTSPEKLELLPATSSSPPSTVMLPVPISVWSSFRVPWRSRSPPPITFTWLLNFTTWPLEPTVT